MAAYMHPLLCSRSAFSIFYSERELGCNTESIILYPYSKNSTTYPSDVHSYPDYIYIYVLGKLREGGSYTRSDALLNDAGELEDSIYRELEHEKTL